MAAIDEKPKKLFYKAGVVRLNCEVKQNGLPYKTNTFRRRTERTNDFLNC
jgi:hypothetical protein